MAIPNLISGLIPNRGQLIAGITLLALSAGGSFWAAWDWRGDKCERDEATAITNALKVERAEVKKKQDKADAEGTSLEKRRAALAKLNRDLDGRYDHEVLSNPVYGSCAYPADGVRLLREAVDAHQRDAPSK